VTRVWTVRQHYDELLAPHYSALFGDFDARVEAERARLARLGIAPRGAGPALDLGCGPGFQALALARLGFRVRAVDFCEPLLDELRRRRGPLPVEAVHGDIRAVAELAPDPVEVAVCMGDTLSHLESLREVEGLLAGVFAALQPEGRLVLTFRDLTGELRDLDRFIPLGGGDDRILTCFLEYEPETVKVHDLVYVREGGRWALRAGVYRKLRLGAGPVAARLAATGFAVDHEDTTAGLVTLVARRPR